MNRTKLSNKELFKGIMTTFLCTVVLAGVMFLMLIIDTGGDIGDFITENVNNIITIAVSLALLSGIIYCYFYFENKTLISRCSKIIEFYLLFIICFLLCYVVERYVNSTARPLLLFSLMAAILMRRRDAIFLNTVFALIMFIYSMLMNNAVQIENFAALLTIFGAGIVGIVLFKSIKTRIACVWLVFVLLIPVLIINVVIQLPAEEVIKLKESFDIIIFSALDCIFSVVLFMAILPIFEVCFAELTPFRLRELTSDNAKLIKLLKKNALGTYSHSLVVAQLAEACADAIGEDPELARAAAYYHDVGKLKNPEMFAENQSDYNMHKELTPELSVDIIRSHARDGAKLIKKNHLPEFFADVAVEHHGTLPIKYFYAKALKLSDGELKVDNYSYSGPTPTTKIAAIIMIADASEAASRSLADRSPEKVEALVRSLIEERMNLDQFVDCDITMRELTVITRTIVNSLTGVYHSRVAYPKLTVSKKKSLL